MLFQDVAFNAKKSLLDASLNHAESYGLNIGDGVRPTSISLDTVSKFVMGPLIDSIVDGYSVLHKYLNEECVPMKHYIMYKVGGTWFTATIREHIDDHTIHRVVSSNGSSFSELFSISL